MEGIEQLIAAATTVRAAEAEKCHAFNAIVRRYQDIAFAIAYAALGDFHHAEDAAQEAFFTAWRCLDQLREPAAFPGWFKRIVLSQCHRSTKHSIRLWREYARIAIFWQQFCLAASHTILWHF